MNTGILKLNSFWKFILITLKAYGNFRILFKAYDNLNLWLLLLKAYGNSKRLLKAYENKTKSDPFTGIYFNLRCVYSPIIFLEEDICVE